MSLSYFLINGVESRTHDVYLRNDGGYKITRNSASKFNENTYGAMGEFRQLSHSAFKLFDIELNVVVEQKDGESISDFQNRVFDMTTWFRMANKLELSDMSGRYAKVIYAENRGDWDFKRGNGGIWIALNTILFKSTSAFLYGSKSDFDMTDISCNGTTFGTQCNSNHDYTYPVFEFTFDNDVMDLTITNNDTSKSFTLSYSGMIGKTIKVDCQTKNVYIDGSIDSSGFTGEFFALEGKNIYGVGKSGMNTLQVSDTNTGATLSTLNIKFDNTYL